MSDWSCSNISVTTGSATMGYLTTTSSGSYGSPLIFTSDPQPVPAPTPRSNLDWLNNEIERICALARLT